jgi:hypothetical protein
LSTDTVPYGSTDPKKKFDQFADMLLAAAP